MGMRPGRVDYRTAANLATIRVHAGDPAILQQNLLDPAANAIGCGICFLSGTAPSQIPEVYGVQKFQRGAAIQTGQGTTTRNPNSTRRNSKGMIRGRTYTAPRTGTTTPGTTVPPGTGTSFDNPLRRF